MILIQYILHSRTTIIVSLLGVLTVSRAAAQGNKGYTTFEEAVATAASVGQPIIVEVWAPWCGWCSKMEKEVYPELQQAFSDRFVFTRLNRDDNSKSIRFRGQSRTPLQIARQLKTETVPALVILNAEGQYMMHLSGFIDADTLIPILQYVSSGAYRRQSFEEFQSTR